MGTAVSFTLQQIGALAGGVWLSPPEDLLTRVSAVCDDSRAIGPGALFVAVRGELTDGHCYLRTAAEAGAVAAVVEDAACASGLHLPVLKVADSLAALQLLARAHRLRWPELAMVALTGSNGKTSTKEIIATILATRWPAGVLKTRGNTNNHFGVPRNLLRLSSQHQAAVVEVGTNHPGEVGALAHLVCPRIGLVTNIGQAHIGNFGSLRAIAEEKASLLSGLPSDGWAVVPADSPHADVLKAASPAPLLTFGESAGADVRVTYRGVVEGGYALNLVWGATGRGVDVVWKLPGRAQAHNAAAAAAVATTLGIGPDAIAAALATCQPPSMRMQTLCRDGIYWVNDAYNANPDSARAGIEAFLEETDARLGMDRRPFLVLGDMLELGETGPAAHVALLEWCRERVPQAEIMAVGPLMEAAGRDGDYVLADCARTALGWLRENLRPGDWVYLKGSRGIHLETILEGWESDR